MGYLSKLVHLSTLLFCLITAVVGAGGVPASKTFRFDVHEYFIDEYTIFDKMEYGANYIEVRNGSFSIAAPPFYLCFFNTTPNNFILGLRAGPSDELSTTFRWVWDANRNHPVHDGAALTFGTDGNLALLHADGHTVAWQTNTANKGVTGINLLRNGNLVLHDAAGKFVWQSFDHPTDTLLLGQSLKVNGLNKLVSRKSNADGSDGPYSLVLENKGLLTKLAHGGGFLTYGGWNGEDFGDLSFIMMPQEKPSKAYQLYFKILSASNISDTPLKIYVSQLTYIPKVTFIRIGSDGSFKGYSYTDQVSYDRWQETFSFFSKKDYNTECYLPARCGAYGLCDEGMCVACPTPKGMLGWSLSCKPPTPPPCQKKAAVVKYYKMEGVGHFLGFAGDSEEAGKLTVEECKARCDKDCKCLGYFYTEYASTCLLAPAMGTLVKDQYTVAYIKYSK